MCLCVCEREENEKTKAILPNNGQEQVPTGFQRPTSKDGPTLSSTAFHQITGLELITWTVLGLLIIANIKFTTNLNKGRFVCQSICFFSRVSL